MSNASSLKASSSIQKALRLAPLFLLTASTLVLSSLVAPRPAFACPPPPKPLRMLYMSSDLVVVARFGQTNPVEVISSGQDGAYKSYVLKTELQVSSTVKGEGNHSVVQVYHWGWMGEGGGINHAFGIDEHSQKALVFLNRREEGDGYELADSSFGVKRLDDAELKIYLQRLEELRQILQEKTPDPKRIVEWLVRCAEEPATRWEGLQELTLSNYALNYKHESEAGKDEEEKAEGEAEAETIAADTKAAESGDRQVSAENSASDATAETSTETGSEEIPTLRVRASAYYEPDPTFAEILTDEQKMRLSNLLFKAKPVTYEEMPILMLVKEWKDPRLVPFLMQQLRSFVDDPPEVAEPIMFNLSEILEDKELAKLAERYSQNAVYVDEESQMAEEATAETEAESEDTPAAETQEEAAAEGATEPSAEQAAEAEEDEVPVIGDSHQQRSIRLQRFLARAETLIGREQTAAR